MRITDLQLGQTKNLMSISDVLSKLNVGDVLKAHILEFAADQLLLKLLDGTTVTASTMVPIDAKKGDLVDFRVKEKTDSQIFIETLKRGEPDTGIEDNIKLRLSRMDIKPDTKNIEIANAIESNNLPVNKEIFEKVLNTLKTFNDLSPQKAAFFASHKINIDEKSIKALSDLVDGKMKIGQTLDSIKGLLEEIEDIKVLDKLEKGLADLKNMKDSENNKNGLYSKFNKSNDAVTAKTSQNTVFTASNEATGIKVSDVLTDGLDKSNSEEIIKLLKNKGEEAETAEILKFLKNNPDGLTGKNGREPDLLLKNLKLHNKNNSEENFINADDTESSHNGKRESILHKTLDNIYVKPDSKNLESELNIKKIYRDIYETLEVIKDSVAGSSIKNSHEILNKIDNVQNNIKFLNEINSYSTYVQIPVNMADKHTSGEIYVLKRDPKRKKINPEDTTMYISLDTQNIGKVDSLINLNKKNISVNMRVEDEKVSGFLKENHKQLYNILAEIGYKLVDLKCRVVSEDANLININDIVKNETAGNRAAIDCKI